MLHYFKNLCGPSLDSHQYSLYKGDQNWTQHSSCVSRGLCREGSPPLAFWLPSAAQEAVDIVWYKYTLQAHAVHWDPKDVLCKAVSQLLRALLHPVWSLWMSEDPCDLSVTPFSFVPTSESPLLIFQVLLYFLEYYKVLSGINILQAKPQPAVRSFPCSK